ncbi:MAG TPA: NAD-dependent epimerase/dehydratase family protein [Polyangiaceae bacterium]|jgi:UDP-apiose/xylose synthase|nr:NAD-dependent epimerase/dehydratase family protein [Polyangiaceae bacterium]
MTFRRIAVLGAGGFLGSHLVPALLARFGATIDAVDVDFRKLDRSDSRIVATRARVEEPALVRDIVGRSDVVISLTALCNPALYSTSPLEVIDASYTHLVPLVEACARYRVRLVHFSTAEVYGRLAVDPSGDRTAEMNEDTSASLFGPVNRERWSYACAKQLLERVIWAHGTHGGLEFSIVRPFNVIGPRMDYVPGVDGEGIPRVLPSFIGALFAGTELKLVDGGQQRRTFMSTRDLTDAVCLLLERREASRGQIFNFGNPANDVSIRELAERLAAEFRARVPSAPEPRLREVSATEFYGDGYDDSEQRIPDIGKAKRLLGWTPADSLSSMLPGIMEDYLKRYSSLFTLRRASRSDRSSVPPAPSSHG